MTDKMMSLIEWYRDNSTPEEFVNDLMMTALCGASTLFEQSTADRIYLSALDCEIIIKKKGSDDD